MKALKKRKLLTWLVAYDIASPKRLRRIAHLCEGYGIRIEKSIFWCHLTATEFAEFWGALEEEMYPEEDVLFACRMCKNCLQDIQTAGAIPDLEPRMWYIL